MTTPTKRKPFAVVIVRHPSACADGYDELADAIAFSLTTLGHEAVIDVGPSADFMRVASEFRAIVLGADRLDQVTYRPAEGSIVYQLDEVAGSPAFESETFRAILRRCVVWEHSATNAGRYVAHGLPTPHVMPIGYHPTFTRIDHLPESAKPLDVLFFGRVTPRAENILDRIHRLGLALRVLPSCDPASARLRDDMLRRSRVVLLMRDHEGAALDELFATYLFANSCAVAAERPAEPRFSDVAWWTDYGDLPTLCRYLVNRPGERAHIAARAFANIATRPMVAYLRDALQVTP